jgi:6-phosphogluconolactonase
VNRPIVNRLPDGAAVADAVAVAVLEKLGAVLQAKPQAHFVVTGGTVGIANLASLARLDDGSVDWSRVHVWWGDERFVEKISGDRNAVQARSAWLSRSAVPESNIHEFPASDQGLDLHAASQLFERELAAFSSTDAAYPEFDLLLLGMGPDGHIASLFPDHEHSSELVVVAVEDSPKPPPMRLSLNYAVINAAAEVWFTVAGADKADAVSVAFGDDPESLPVGRVAGKARTVWFVDQTAGVKTWGC